MGGAITCFLRGNGLFSSLIASLNMAGLSMKADDKKQKMKKKPRISCPGLQARPRVSICLPLGSRVSALAKLGRPAVLFQLSSEQIPVRIPLPH